MGRLCVSLKEQIIALTKADHSQRDIGTLTIARTTDHSVLKKFNESGSVVNKKSSGRPIKVSPSGVRVLARLATCNCHSSVSALTYFFNHAKKTSASKWTIKHCFIDEGFMDGQL